MPVSVGTGFETAAVHFLGRFGLVRGAPPTPERLDALYSAFAHLPYENVSKIVSTGTGTIRLQSPEEVIEGYLHSRLGGTCFSLTQCLYELLLIEGFQAWRVLGDMAHGENIHCAVVAEAGERAFLCDTGYLLPQPLALPGPGGFSRLDGELYTYTLAADKRDSRVFHLYTQSPAGDKRWRYRIRNLPLTDDLFELHWRRTYNAAMMHQLVLSRAVPEGQIYIHNHKLRLAHREHKKNSNLRGSLAASVEELFGINRALVEAALARIEEAKAAGKGSG